MAGKRLKIVQNSSAVSSTDKVEVTHKRKGKVVPRKVVDKLLSMLIYITLNNNEPRPCVTLLKTKEKGKQHCLVSINCRINGLV